MGTPVSYVKWGLLAAACTVFTTIVYQRTTQAAALFQKVGRAGEGPKNLKLAYQALREKCLVVDQETLERNSELQSAVRKICFLAKSHFTRLEGEQKEVMSIFMKDLDIGVHAVVPAIKRCENLDDLPEWLVTHWLKPSYSDVLRNIQPNRHDAFNQALDFLGMSAKERKKLQFRLLTGGFSATKLYCFSYLGKQYVVKFIRFDDEAVRAKEVRAYKAVDKLGISPKFLFTDKSNLVVLTEFITGGILSPSKLDNNVISSLAKKMRKLHTMNDRNFPEGGTASKTAEFFYRKGKKDGGAFPNGFLEAIEGIKKESEGIKVPCHAGLNWSNILCDERQNAYLIDWEDSGWDNPYHDLAYLCVRSKLTPEQEAHFLKEYFGREPSKAELAMLKKGKAVYFLGTAAVWFCFSETPEERKKTLEEREKWLEHELSKGDLREAEDYIQKDQVPNFRTDSKKDVKLFALSCFAAYRRYYS